MRTDKELLKLLLEVFDYYFKYGLCMLVNRVFLHRLITNPEYKRLKIIIKEAEPSGFYDSKHYPYYWKLGNKTIRKKWLREQIKLLK